MEDASGNPGPELAVRLEAAKTLDRDTAWEVIDDPSVLESCVGVFGDLSQAQKISDEHIRLVVDCLLRDTTEATTQLYDTFKKLPPFYRREQEIVAVAVGAATLQYIRDEQDIIASVLAEGASDEEGKQVAARAEAICNAIDRISACMPDTAGEVRTHASVDVEDERGF